jgi:hypothetical protein
MRREAGGGEEGAGGQALGLERQMIAVESGQFSLFSDGGFALVDFLTARSVFCTGWRGCEVLASRTG